jgi:hypothetical protein
LAPKNAEQFDPRALAGLPGFERENARKTRRGGTINFAEGAHANPRERCHVELPGRDNVRALAFEREKTNGRGQIQHLPNASNPHLEIISGELSNLLCAAKEALVYLKVIHTHKPLNGDGK